MVAATRDLFPSDRVTSLATVGFDEDNWGVGVSGVVDNPSPYARINALRDWYLDECPYTVDAERALLVTEAYQKFADEPQLVKVAKAFAHILRNVRLQITVGQLLVGDSAAPPKACPIYPEFSYEWIVGELKNQPVRQRPHNRYDYGDETERSLLGIADYWHGRTLSDAMLARMTPEEMKGDFMGIMLYSTSLYHVAGVGHLVPDFERLLQKGYGGLRRDVQEKLEALGGADATTEQKRTFYRAQLIALEATSDYIRRYAALARTEAQAAVGRRQDELRQMAANCDQIAEGTPQTFWQAFQLVQLAWSLVQIESNGHSVSLGRLDQLLYPWYRRDLDSGAATRDFMQEIIECHAVLNASFMKLRDWVTTQNL